MAYLPTNSTNTPLGANQSFIGESYQIDKEYISITCSFNSNVGGILEFFHSIDGFSFSTYGDVYDFTTKPGSHSIEVSVKGKFFKIKFTNGSTPQTSFNLFCKLNREVAESILNSIYDSVGVVNAEEGGLNIRHLNATDDKVNLPQLDPIIIDDDGATCLNVRVNSMPPIVIPPITISDINIHDSNGNDIIANSSGYLQTEIMNTSLTVSGSVSVSNQISGYALNSTLTSTNSKLDSLITGTRILASNGNTISTANGNLLTNLYANSPSGYAPLSSGTPQNTTFNALMVMNKDTIKATVEGVVGDLAGTNISGRGVSLYVDETNSSNILAGITGIQNILSTQGITGSVHITNDIIVVNPINNSITETPYDLLINGNLIWADSTPLVNPFFADTNGREGWYYDNFNNIANKSNIYWYANPISGNLQENDMTFAQLSTMYCIITPDYVENGSLTIPTMAVYSQPTGPNDFIPGFAHSRWVYQLSSSNLSKLRKAETILLYTGLTRPNVHLNIPSYPLNLVSQNGDALTSEIISYMSINTQSSTSKIGYLLQITGFLNSAIGFNHEYQFRNSKERIIQNNQYSGYVGITGTPTVNVGNSSLNVNETNSTAILAGITGIQDILTNQGITGSIYITNSSLNVNETNSVNILAGITGIENILTNQGITGSIYITNSSLDVNETNSTAILAGITGIENILTNQGITGSIYITNSSLNVNETNSANILAGITGIENILTTQGITGSIYITNSSLDVNNESLDKLQFTNTTNYLKVNVENFPSGGSVVSIKDSDGYNLSSVSSTIPQLRTTLYDKDANFIGSSETSSGSGVYALRTFNTELNNSYNATAFGLQTAPKLYNGSSYFQQKGDNQGRAEVNINSSGTAITHTGTALDVEIKNSGNIGVQVNNSGNINVSVQNTSLNTHIMGYDEDTLTYKDVSVDSNGFLNVNAVENVHQNIEIGYDNNVDKYTKFEPSNYLTWSNQNPYSKSQNGWYVSGSTVNSARLAWYNNGNYIPTIGTQTPFNTQYNFTKADIDIWYMIIQNYNCSSTNTFPYIIVMSKPTGSNDFSPAAHSIWIYTIDANQFINNGSSIMIYNGNLARVKNNDVECPRVSYSLTSSWGDCSPTEIIGHIIIETPTSSGNTIDMNVIEAAVYVKNKGLINYYFTNDNIDLNRLNNTVKLDTTATNNTIKIDTSNNRIKLTDGTNTATLTQSGVLNNRYAQDVYIQNGSIVNSNNTPAITVYNINTKQARTFSGFTTQTGSVIVGYGNNITGSTYFGAVQNYYAWSNTNKTLNFDYIDSTGNESSYGNISLVANTWTNLNLSCYTISRIATVEYNASGSQLVLSTAASATNQVYGLTDFNTYYGVLMCPNNKIQRILNIYFFSAASMRFHIMVGNKINRTSKSVYTGLGFSNSNITFAGDGIILLPGEYIYLLKEAIASTEIVFYCSVIQEDY
jgi:hypothetical protein